MSLSRRLLVLPAALAFASTAGCFTLDFDEDGEIDRLPPLGYEVDFQACANGRDDDMDGRIDCADTDCLMRGHCGERVPTAPVFHPENRFDWCSDGVDNDDDGQFDCGDRGCQDIRELCCLAEFDDATCSDGRDNDGNGFADCADFSCRNGVFVTVCEEETSCTNGIDDDGDRFTDCNDRDCQGDPACAERDCDDGEDDDGNGLVDCADPACAGDDACPPESDCGNGVDDNGDGRTDCADFSCAGDPACSGPENTEDRCMDDADNDDDGFVDCADFDCEAFCDPEEGLAACMDGFDNDGNGFVDCDDFSCSRSMDAEVREYCEGLAENTLDKCTDGEDNDGNGFTDCDDNGCRFADDERVREACESTFETCVDLRDNNDNGFTDCADFSCRFLTARLTADCTEDGDCPAGQSCFRTRCILVESPCFEGMDIGNESFEDLFGAVPDDLTQDERRRMVVAGCTDGEDDDRDGFVDCEDWDCNHNPLARRADGTPICRYAGGRTCVTGPNAGMACGSDDDCAGVEDSCGPPGPEGQVFVCP
ncbi:MAG TPA: hypothetical protein RMH99_23815 [Sandaracinaceae bacterium LLY-WYZ-13_1]|nr:hypothetical protein [Sandaracinaceae bacterium LLY-WYZ-13_1]